MKGSDGSAGLDDKVAQAARIALINFDDQEERANPGPAASQPK